MALFGTPLLLRTQGRLRFLVLAAQLCFLTPLEVAGDATIPFDSDIVPLPIPGDGVPGQHYPLLAAVPDTGFSCTDQFPGYYADTAAKAACQVFHVCQPGGRRDSFLCPNGTVFSQQHLVCDWWYNVDCAASEKFRRTTIAVAAAGTEQTAAASRAGSSDPARGKDGTVTKSVHHHVPSSHQQTHHALTPRTAVPGRHAPPAPRNTSSLQPHPQVSLTQHQQSSLPVLPHHPVALTSQQLQTPPLPQSHQSSQHSTSILAHESTQDNVPQSTVTHHHYSNHQSVPQHSVIQKHQSNYQTLPQSIVTQNHNPVHHSPSQLTSTHHPPLPTLFREDVTALSPLRTRFPSRYESPGHQLSLSLTPVLPHSAYHPNIDLNNAESLEGEQHTFPSQVSEQENSLISPQFIKDHAAKLDFRDSLEAGNSLTDLHAPYKVERIEYDEVYSATLFPPNLPQVADVYDAAKGNVLIDIVREPGRAPSFPAPSASTRESLLTKGSLLRVPKPQRMKAKHKHNEPVISNRIPRTQDLATAHESSPRDVSSPLIISSPRDSVPSHRFFQPPSQLFSGHSSPQITSTSPPPPPAAKHDPTFPHHVWRPTHGPFPLSLTISPAPDVTLNFLDTSPQIRSIVSATPEPFQVSTTQPPSRNLFRVTHEEFPSSQSSVATHSSFAADLHDTPKPLQLPSTVHKSPAGRHGTSEPRLLPSAVNKSPAGHHGTPEPRLLPSAVNKSPAGHHGTPEPHLLPSAVNRSPAGHHGTPEPFSLPSTFHKPPETSSHSLPNSRQSFLVIHETSPLGQGDKLPPYHILLRKDNPPVHPRPLELSSAVQEPLEVSSRSISDTRNSFLVIHEPSISVHDAPSPPHPRPVPVPSNHRAPTHQPRHHAL